MPELSSLSTIVKTSTSALTLAFSSLDLPLTPIFKPFYQDIQEEEPFVLDIIKETLQFSPIDLISSARVEDNGNYDITIGTTYIGEQDRIASIIEQSEAIKRKVSVTRRQRSFKRTRLQQDSLVGVRYYIEIEKEKYIRLGILYSQRNYLHANLVDWISLLDREKERDTVIIISIRIGSLESIAYLQYIIIESRG